MVIEQTGADGPLVLRHRDVIIAQTKTRERVRDLAEVYTHEREVTAMLGLVPSMFPSDDRPRDIGFKFLEPACGAGNFLVAILDRKLSYVRFGDLYQDVETFESACLRALSSVYGIDIDPENVEQSRQFMHADLAHHVNLQLGAAAAASDGFWSAVDAILTTNIVRADTLKDAPTIELVDYHWAEQDGYVTREWSFLEEHDDEQLDLFAELSDTPRRDAIPIHYSKLAASPAPVTP